MRIIVYGANGAMGNKLRAIAGNDIAAAVSRSFKTDKAKNEFRSLGELDAKADVLIDFSNHEAIGEILNYCILSGTPAVIATTGHSDDEKEQIRIASESIPIFYSANMSLGVALLSDLVKRAVRAFPDAEIEIVEIHHDRKLDAPSGTALAIADAISKVREGISLNIGRKGLAKRTPDEIGVHSLRIGNVTGTHEVIISTGLETITLKHEAHDRALFANGALRAAAFIKDKSPGLYDMTSLIGN